MWTRGVDTELFGPERSSATDLPRPIFVTVGRRAVEGEALAAHLGAADVFVFPSRTDTFGVVQLEALACGVPVAAYPVPGPQDVIGSNPVGVLDEDLKSAGIRALSISRAACRKFALTQSWERSAAQFISHCRPGLRWRTT